MSGQLKAKDDEIARLKATIAQKDQEISKLKGGANNKSPVASTD